MLKVVTPTAKVKYQASCRLTHPPGIAGELCLKVQKSFLDTVSTGSDSDLVNEGSQESLGTSRADH